MGKVTESIFSGDSVVIPMADVCYVQKDNRAQGYANSIWVVMNGSTADHTDGTWHNAPWLKVDEAARFMKAWCQYRAELESETILNIMESK